MAASTIFLRLLQAHVTMLTYSDVGESRAARHAHHIQLVPLIKSACIITSILLSTFRCHCCYQRRNPRVVTRRCELAYFVVSKGPNKRCHVLTYVQPQLILDWCITKETIGEKYRGFASPCMSALLIPYSCIRRRR